MLVSNISAELKAKAGLGKLFQGVLAASLATNILMAAGFAGFDKSVRTIFTPPQITKSFWVEGEELSPEYLEQMGLWVIDLFANVSPSSIDYKIAQILRYVDPAIHGELQLRFKAGADRLKAENISKVFSPRDVSISPSRQAIAFIGTQDVWLGDKKISTVQIAYLVRFSNANGMTTIRELRETDPKKPFDTPAATDNSVQFQMAQPEASAPSATSATGASPMALPPAPPPAQGSIPEAIPPQSPIPGQR